MVHTTTDVRTKIVVDAIVAEHKPAWTNVTPRIYDESNGMYCDTDEGLACVWYEYKSPTGMVEADQYLEIMKDGTVGPPTEIRFEVRYPDDGTYLTEEQARIVCGEIALAIAITDGMVL